MLKMARRKAMMRRFLSIAGMLLQVAAASRLHEHLTFTPPFLDVNHFGQRFVGPDWDAAGNTKTMKNFVRLTPDQQSKRGSLWSTKAIGDTVFSSILEFRISGKGERFFGDGLAFWVAEPPVQDHWFGRYGHRDEYYDDMDIGGWGADDDGVWGGPPHPEFPSGSYHGFVETFTGVGVILDTYRNEEFYDSHKDVTIVVNNGNMTVAEMMTESKGCNARVRYYENRDDFEAGAHSSRLKVELVGDVLTVKIDAKNTGEWQDCNEVTLRMKPAWAKQAHIGVTSSTGQLSDNHDVIRLETFISSRDADVGENRLKRQKEMPVEMEPDLPLMERLAKLETVVNALLIKMELMDHKQEHNVEDVDKHVTELFNKLSGNERELEKLVKLIETKVEQLEERLSSHLDDRLSSGLGEAVQLSRGWKMPFAVLVLGLVATGAWLYQTYQKMRKSHLL